MFVHPLRSSPDQNAVEAPSVARAFGGFDHPMDRCSFSCAVRALHPTPSSPLPAGVRRSSPGNGSSIKTAKLIADLRGQQSQGSGDEDKAAAATRRARAAMSAAYLAKAEGNREKLRKDGTRGCRVRMQSKVRWGGQGHHLAVLQCIPHASVCEPRGARGSSQPGPYPRDSRGALAGRAAAPHPWRRRPHRGAGGPLAALRGGWAVYGVASPGGDVGKASENSEVW